MPATDPRSASTLMIVGLFAASLIVLAVLLNILALFISFDTPVMGLLVVLGAAGVAATYWFAQEKAPPASGRAWTVALICGVVSGILSAALAVFGLSGDAQWWKEFSEAGALSAILLFAAITGIQILIVRLGFWLTFRKAAKTAA